MKGQEENAEQRQDFQVDPIHADGWGHIAGLLKPAGLVSTPSHQVHAQHEPEFQSWGLGVKRSFPQKKRINCLAKQKI